MSTSPTRATIYEDTGITCMARILGDDAAAITQSTTSAITVAVFKNASTTATYTASLTVADVVFNSYQTDARWDLDSTGYNFRYAVISSVFDEGDATYRVEFKFTPTSGSQYFVVYMVDTVEIFTS
tara:strand:+ start:1670 stop:2047 length:378 start_codon:yes stop_codon:yes gene_type:complete